MARTTLKAVNAILTTEKKSLREMMTHNLRMSGWLDFCYERGDKDATSFKMGSADDYTNWLNSLDDDEFLSAYDRVKEAESKLD